MPAKFFKWIFIAAAASSGFCCCKQGKNNHTSGADSARAREGRNSEDHHPGGRSPSTVESILKQGSDENRRTRDDLENLNKRILSLDMKDLIQLLGVTGKNRNSPKDRYTFELAIAELAKRDPSSVMSWFMPEDMIRGEPGFAGVASILANSSPQILEKWLLEDLSKATGPVQNQSLRTVLMCLGKVDARAAFEFASKQTWKYHNNSEIINDILPFYANQSPLEAAKAAATAYKGSDLQLALHNIALGASSKDPELGMELANKIEGFSNRGDTQAGILTDWLDSDHAAALRKLQEIEPRELQASLQALADSPLSLVTKLAVSDPDVLCELLGKLTASSANEELFQTAVSGLSTKYPEKALALVESMSDGDMKKGMLGTQYRAMAAADSADALAKASQISTESLRTEAYFQIGDVVASSNGLDATLKIANSLPENDRKIFVGAAIPLIANRNPKEVAELLLNGGLTLDAGKRQEILCTLGENLSGTDSKYSQDWLSKLPSDDQRSAMKGIASEMAKSDIQGLAAMLGSLPQDPKWETGVRVLIDNIRTSDPEMAKKWQEALVSAGYK